MEITEQENLESLLLQTLNWDYILKTAASHCILPLLCWHLLSLKSIHVPIGIQRELQAFFQQNTVHNFLLTRELLKIIDLLHNNNIVVAPLKGPVLAMSVYGNLSLRMFGDLDILVHKRDINMAKDVLLAQGYKLQVDLTQEQEKVHLKDDAVFEFMRSDGRFPLELHWGITAPCIPFPLNLDHLEGRLNSVELSGVSIPNIAPEETLIILCVHGTKHIWSRLAWICDVAELIRSTPELNWQRVIEQAQTLQVSRMVALGLFLAQDVLQVILPEFVNQWVASQRIVPELSKQVQQRLFAGDDVSRIEDDFFIMQTMERFADRFAYAVHLAVTPSAKERSTLKLPASISFLWYIIRPARLIMKYTLRAVRRKP